MNINKLRIKENITLKDKIVAIDLIVDYHFSENPLTGDTDYTPYYSEIGKKVVFFKYFVNGFKTSEKDEYLNTIIASDELNTFYRKNRVIDDFQYVLKHADDIVEFKKQQLIHRSPLDSLLSTINDYVKKQNEFDPEMLTQFMQAMTKVDGVNADSIVEAYSKTQFAKDNKRELEAQNKVTDLAEAKEAMDNGKTGK